MNDMARLALGFCGKESTVEIAHIPGPMGVRGRNSDNTLIKQVLGWAPSISLADGLRRTYEWINEQVIPLFFSSKKKKNHLRFFFSLHMCVCVCVKDPWG